MTTAQHVDQLFSAAIDHELSPAQEQRFHDHLAECSDCSASYRTFSDAVAQVRALPRAAMPLPVHLPSGAPASERATASEWLRHLVPRRFPMGAASGVGALAAAAIVAIALTRGSAPATSAPTAPDRLSTGSNGSGAAAAPALCPLAASNGTAPSFTYRTSVSDRSRPGQQLVLTASDSTAAAGSQVRIYAALTVPAQAVGAPGAAASNATTTITPCLSISGASGAAFAPSGAPPAPAQVQQGAAAPSTLGGETFTIPPGTPPGTVIHVVATVPANYPSSSQSPLTATLDITVR